jgi:hypothetical protein
MHTRPAQPSAQHRCTLKYAAPAGPIRTALGRLRAPLHQVSAATANLKMCCPASAKHVRFRLSNRLVELSKLDASQKCNVDHAIQLQAAKQDSACEPPRKVAPLPTPSTIFGMLFRGASPVEKACDGAVGTTAFAIVVTRDAFRRHWIIRLS